jgi:hypothetical protein
MSVILVCGDRYWTNQEAIFGVLSKFVEINDIEGMEMIMGECRGADQMATEFCEKEEVDHQVFDAEWSTHGKSAGPRRNARMIKYLLEKQEQGKGILVIAFHDSLTWNQETRTVKGESKGTKDTLTKAKKANIPFCLVHSDGSIIDCSE